MSARAGVEHPNVNQVWSASPIVAQGSACGVARRVLHRSMHAGERFVEPTPRYNNRKRHCCVVDSSTVRLQGKPDSRNGAFFRFESLLREALLEEPRFNRSLGGPHGHGRAVRSVCRDCKKERPALVEAPQWSRPSYPVSNSCRRSARHRDSPARGPAHVLAEWRFMAKTRTPGQRAHGAARGIEAKRPT